MEKEALIQFRKNLSDVLKPDVTDSMLLKWLRARNFDLRKCERMYREHSWGLEVLNIGEHCDVHRFPEVVEKYHFTNPLGFAKDGTPVYYIAMGRGDLKGFVNSLDIIDICRYCIYVIEQGLLRCREQSKKLGKDINEVTYIIDMEKLSFRAFWFDGMMETSFDLFQHFQDQFPEVWRYILVINVPYYFQSIFNIFKPILRNTLLQKIYLARKNHSANLLLKYIDPEELPEFLGGKKVDSSGDSMCKEFMRLGGLIPEEYYIQNIRPPLQPTDPGVQDVWIPPKGFYNFPFVAREPNAVIAVEIRTEGSSVAARVLFKKFGPDPEQLDLPATDELLDDSHDKGGWNNVLARGHLQCHISPIQNVFTAPWPGIYVYSFDNAWNWLTSRRVIFRIRVLPPGTTPF